MTQRIVSGLTAAFLAGIPFANAAEKNNCNGLPQAGDLSNVSLATIAEKANFLANESDKPGCPAQDAKCRSRAYLLRGDKVMIDSDDLAGSFVCSVFIDKRGTETDGWLPRSAVQPIKTAPDWAGKWKRDQSATIEIKRKAGGKIAIEGTATYGTGAATHEGGLEADLASKLQIQGFATDGTTQLPYKKANDTFCAAILGQFGPYLVVHDNDRCGGANVTFTGVYARR